MDSSTSTYHQKRGHMFFLEHSVERALCNSHVNGATKLKRYNYIGIGQ